MAQVTEKLPGEPIVIATYSEPYKPAEDVRAANIATAQILEDTTELIYFINDVRNVNANFSQLVSTLATAFRDRTTLPPGRVKGIVVGLGDIVQLFVDAAKQMQYGKVDVELFATLEEALEYARNQIAQAQEGEAAG